MRIVRYEQNGSIVAIDDGRAAAARRAWEIAFDARDGPVVEGANLLAPVVTGVLCIGLN